MKANQRRVGRDPFNCAAGIVYTHLFSRRKDFRSGQTSMLSAVQTISFLVLTVMSTLVVLSAEEHSKPGELLWQDRRNAGLLDLASCVATDGTRVAVCGRVFSPATGTRFDMMLRVYDASSGTLQWESRFDFDHGTDTSEAVAISQSTIVAVGEGRMAANHRLAWIVSAYDASSGSLLWRDELQRGSGDFRPEAVVIRGHRAFVTGIGGEQCNDAAFGNCDQLTRAYDLASGALLWEVQYDAAGADDDSLFVAADERRVFVVGAAGSTPGDERTFSTVRAYDARTGALVWSDAVPDPMHHGFNLKVVVAGGRVFAAGVTNDDWLVRAYEAENGRILWNATYRLLGFSAPGVLNAPVQMAANEDSVSVGGYGSTRPFDRSSRQWVVNTYHAATGRLGWSDVLDAQLGQTEVNTGLVLANGQTIAFGFIAGRSNWLVRSYETRRGRVIWQDHADGLSNGILTGLAAACGRVTGVGAVGNGDWLVRTYRIGREDTLSDGDDQGTSRCEESRGANDGERE